MSPARGEGSPIDEQPTPPGPPLRIGQAEDFALARRFFAAAAYNDQTVCRILGIPAPSELAGVAWDRVQFDAGAAPLRWCMETFLRGLMTREEDARAICGEETFAALRALDLLHESQETAGALFSPVWLYPVEGFLTVSDWNFPTEIGPKAMPRDVVFPASDAGTLRFLRLLLPADGDSLDLCGGTGIAALHLSRKVRSVVTADLTERASHYAAFNARLNDCAVEVLCGDLFAPLAGRQFDAIVAHPPFVPAIDDTVIFRDAGETGEEITRRIVEALPAHLRPHGTCLILCGASDIDESPFEQRARTWLGAAAAEFDVIFGLHHTLTIEDVVSSLCKRVPQDRERLTRELTERFRALHVRQFVYGALVMHRSTGPVAAAPMRVRMTNSTTGTDLDRLLAWRRHTRSPGFDEWLAKARPRLAPKLELAVRCTVRNGELAPAEFAFSIDDAFHAVLRPDAWVVPVLTKLQGDASVAQTLEAARRAGDVPEGFTLEPFGGLIKMMIERGFLEVDLPGGPMHASIARTENLG